MVSLRFQTSGNGLKDTLGSRFNTLKGYNMNNHRFNRWKEITHESTTLKRLNVLDIISSSLSWLIGLLTVFHPDLSSGRLFKLNPFRTLRQIQYTGLILFLFLYVTYVPIVVIFKNFSM
jgi:arginyl-tRNA--protein-N-Asp/Glu arginylyltransferase